MDPLAEDKLLSGILIQARVEDSEAVARMLAQCHIKASDLIAETDVRAAVDGRASSASSRALAS